MGVKRIVDGNIIPDSTVESFAKLESAVQEKIVVDLEV